jgi:hypothetical protein
MIEKIHPDNYQLSCDGENCDYWEDGFETFQDALDHKKDEGWRNKPDGDGGWLSYCPDCSKLIFNH